MATKQGCYINPSILALIGNIGGILAGKGEGAGNLACPKVAVSDAMVMSHIIASSQPPPRAAPFTAAMSGFLSSRRPSQPSSKRPYACMPAHKPAAGMSRWPDMSKKRDSSRGMRERFRRFNARHLESAVCACVRVWDVVLAHRLSSCPWRFRQNRTFVGR